jgi:hypothetical protein
MSHREGKADRYRRVHGVAALPQDLNAHIGRQGLLCSNQGVAGTNRLTRGYGDAQYAQTYEQPSHESILANWPKG